MASYVLRHGFQFKTSIALQFEYAKRSRRNRSYRVSDRGEAGRVTIRDTDISATTGQWQNEVLE